MQPRYCVASSKGNDHIVWLVLVSYSASHSVSRLV